MSILSWIVLGLIAGFLSSMVVKRQGSGIVLDIVIGIAGALVGGYLFHALGWGDVSGFNLYSILIAVVGAVVVLVIWHAILRAIASPPR